MPPAGDEKSRAKGGLEGTDEPHGAGDWQREQVHLLHGLHEGRRVQDLADAGDEENHRQEEGACEAGSVSMAVQHAGHDDQAQADDQGVGPVPPREGGGIHSCLPLWQTGEAGRQELIVADDSSGGVEQGRYVAA